MDNCSISDYIEIMKRERCIKPPIGLMPKHIHDEMRFNEVSKAIAKYYSAGLKIPIEWIKEYNDYIRNNLE